MCMILDANVWGDFFSENKPKNEDMECIHEWIRKRGGKLIYTNRGRFGAELNKSANIKNRMAKYLADGQARFKTSEKIVELEKEFEKNGISHNDSHILALAEITGAKILCTADNKLQQEFKNNIRKGKIYSTKKNKNLLTRDTCP